jgi:hypothetical protein
MEVTNTPTSPAIDPNVIEDGTSKIKQKLGAARRRIKQIDLRQVVIDNPFPAVGIGLAVGAIVGLARPMPKHSRVAGALGSVATALIIRMVKNMAMAQFGTFARDFMSAKTESSPDGRDVNTAAPF